MTSKLFSRNLNTFPKLLSLGKCGIYSTNNLFHKLSKNANINSRQLLNNCNNSLIISNKINKCIELLPKRCLSQKSDKDNESEDEGLDEGKTYLMDFKPILFPNLWYKWKNFLIINTTIRPFLDNDFTLDKFMFGAKQALVQISNRLADEDMDSVADLITEEAFTQIQQNYSKMTSNERKGLRVQFEDIIYSFPYRVGIIMNDNDDKRYVEITVVFYCLYKYHTLSKGLTYAEFKDKFGDSITVCNYRFIRDYTKGVESEWTVNMLGHFNKRSVY